MRAQCAALISSREIFLIKTLFSFPSLLRLCRGFFYKGEEGNLFLTFTFFPCNVVLRTVLVRRRRCLEIRKVEREREEGACFYRNGFRARFGGKRVGSPVGRSVCGSEWEGGRGPFVCARGRGGRGLLSATSVGGRIGGGGPF